MNEAVTMQAADLLGEQRLVFWAHGERGDDAGATRVLDRLHEIATG